MKGSRTVADEPERPKVEPLYSEIEAARLIGIKPRALRSEREAGRIAYRRVAGLIMYRQDDLAAWQESIAIPARAAPPR